MRVLSPKYPGLTVICSNCGALLAYNRDDVYGDSIYCPQCKAKTVVPLLKDYDGSVKENGK